MKLVVTNMLLVVLIVLPFLPGPSNKVVVVLSGIAQAAGFFGLLVVPIALIWAIVEIWEWRKSDIGNVNWKTTYNLAITALVIITVVSLFLIIGVTINAGIFTGIIVMILVVFQTRWAIREIRKRRNSPVRKFSHVPFYLLTIPLVSLIVRTQMMEPLSNNSRNIAIEKSQVLIDAIESYRKEEGEYPESIQELKGSYLKVIPTSGIMGIDNFRYSNVNGNYSLSFSQWLEIGSLEEIVLYDKSNLKANVKRDYKTNLKANVTRDYQLDLWRVNTAFASYDTGLDNWRYYHLD